MAIGQAVVQVITSQRREGMDIHGWHATQDIAHAHRLKRSRMT